MVTTYGYARVSTKEQNLERQITAMKGYRQDIPDSNIFVEKETGKQFDREQYQTMKTILNHLSKTKQPEDVLEVVFEELDRLGRNAEGIKQELSWYKSKGICVRILEIPTTLIEVRGENKWVTELINQILIEVYAAMAEQELEKRAKRQREGITEAQKKGVRFGRPFLTMDQNQFEGLYKRWKDGQITAVWMMKQLGLKPNTFYRRVSEYEKYQQKQKNQTQQG